MWELLTVEQKQILVVVSQVVAQFLVFDKVGLL